MGARQATTGRTGRVAPGQDLAWELYQAHGDGLIRMAYLLTGSQAVAEDLVHDVILRVQGRLGSADQPLAYLRRSVTNACCSWHRRHRREVVTAPESMTNRGPGPTGPAATGHPAVEMWDLINRLNERQRAVLVLRYYLDMTELEIARTLGLRPGTVKSTAHRALADLRRMLA